MGVEYRLERENRPGRGPYRRRTLAEKLRIVEQCLKPGASVAGVALERQVNANLLRRWVKEAGAQALVASVIAASAPEPASSFMPLRISVPKDTAREERPIRVHIRKARTRITIEWPASAAAACAVWLKELLG